MVLFHCLTVPITESKIGLIQYPTSPTRAKILSLRSSPRYSLPRSFLKELSLEQLDYLRMHIIYKNRHRKQLYGVQSSGLMVQRQMAVNWLKSLRKYRQCDVQAQSSSRAKGQKGSHFCFVLQRYELITGSREPPFHTNTDFSERLTGINSPHSNSQR